MEDFGLKHMLVDKLLHVLIVFLNVNLPYLVDWQLSPVDTGRDTFAEAFSFWNGDIIRLHTRVFYDFMLTSIKSVLSFRGLKNHTWHDTLFTFF